MPYGTIIFIALILVVACSLLYWLSALCGDYSHPKRDRKRRSRSLHFPTGNNRALWRLHAEPKSPTPTLPEVLDATN